MVLSLILKSTFQQFQIVLDGMKEFLYIKLLVYNNFEGVDFEREVRFIYLLKCEAERS